MITEQLISPVVPTLLPTDTGSKALILMEENNLNQLPLVIEEKYMGLVNENDVLDWEKPDREIGGGAFLLHKPAVLANGHPYDALKLAHQQNLSVVPVVDGHNTYMGSITRDALLNYFAENSGLDNPGGIVVLEVDPKNYSLSEIARVCEHEEVFVTSTHVFTNTATGKLEVTIKTNRTNMEPIVDALERHNFKVKEVFGELGNRDDLQDRYNLLMNYINM